MNTETLNVGRPEIQIDMEQLAIFCRLKPTLVDCANFFKCSEKTIERRIRDVCNLSFVEFREQNTAVTRHNLIRKAIAKAEAGDNTMLIFTLKNLCGWRDKQQGEEDKVVVNNIQDKIAGMTEEQIDARIKELSKKLYPPLLK